MTEERTRVHIDRLQRRIHLKLVYYGVGSGGKTTNLSCLYDRLPSAARGPRQYNAEPHTRTIFFTCTPPEYALFRDYRLALSLYTISGTSLYQETRVNILQEADGVVFVLDSQRSLFDENDKSFQELHALLASQHPTSPIDAIPLILQYNKRDLPTAMSIDTLETAFNQRSYPAFPAIASQGVGVYETFLAACAALVNNLNLSGYGAISDR